MQAVPRPWHRLARAVREAAKKKERRVLFIKSRNLTLDQSEILYIFYAALRLPFLHQPAYMLPDRFLVIHNCNIQNPSPQSI